MLKKMKSLYKGTSTSEGYIRKDTWSFFGPWAEISLKDCGASRVGPCHPSGILYGPIHKLKKSNPSNLSRWWFEPF